MPLTVAGNAETLVPLGRNITLTLPGLNLQWPFSRLLLTGQKTIEVRKYPLFRSIQDCSSMAFIVETPGESNDAFAVAVGTGLEQLSPRPVKAQIIGVARFQDDGEYTDVAAYQADRAQHCINPDCSSKEWNGAGKRYKWRVTSTSELREYVLEDLPTRGMRGFGPTALTGDFVSPRPQAERKDTVLEHAGAEPRVMSKRSVVSDGKPESDVTEPLPRKRWRKGVLTPVWEWRAELEEAPLTPSSFKPTHGLQAHVAPQSPRAEP